MTGASRAQPGDRPCIPYVQGAGPEQGLCARVYLAVGNEIETERERERES